MHGNPMDVLSHWTSWFELQWAIRANMQKHVKWFLKLCISGVVLLYLLNFVHANLQGLHKSPSSLSLLAICVSLLMYLVWLLLYKNGWEFVYRRGFGNRITTRKSVTSMAFALSMLYRYIPGKAFLALARTEYLKQHGESRVQVLTATFVEQVNFAVTPLPLFFFTVPFISTFPVRFLQPYRWPLFFLAVLAFTMWLFVPCYFYPWVNKLVRRSTGQDTSPYELRSARVWHIIVVLFLGISTFQGLLTVPIIGELSVRTLHMGEWCYLIAAYPFSRVVGQLGGLTPGGLGIREGMYVLVAGHILGSGIAMFVSVWFRLISIFAEILFFLLVLTVGRIQKHSVGDGHVSL